MGGGTPQALACLATLTTALQNPTRCPALQDWIKCIQAAMQKDPIYEMFAMRRNKQRSNY